MKDPRERAHARLVEHVRQADAIVALLDQLRDMIRSAALDVHDEIETIHERVDQLERMHEDPAAHGRRSNPPHDMGS